MTQSNHDTKGRFTKGNAYSRDENGKGITHNPHGKGSQRLSGRHWMRRALEIPESEWPKVSFCAADANARKLVKELRTLKGKDFVQALSTAHHDAYGQEARLEVAGSPGAMDAAAEIMRIEAEIDRILKGRK